jgi:hypothetical protein
MDTFMTTENVVATRISGLDVSKLNRRWCQYSLRMLMTCITLFAVACSLLTVILQRAIQHELAIEAIWKAGGQVAFDYQFDAIGNLVDDPRPPGPSWLRKILGDHFFTRIRYVDMTCSDHIDNGLERLKDLQQVPTLYLFACPVTDAELVHLQELSTLKELGLWFTDISDAGLDNLKDLNQLQELNLDNTKITDAGLKHIKGLTNLEELRLGGNRISAVGIAYLKGLPKLKVLRLSDTNITDAGLEHLGGLRQLKELDLSKTHISDVGLEHLQCLDRLEKLWLSDTKVTSNGVKKLQHALPNCEIYCTNLIFGCERI